MIFSRASGQIHPHAEFRVTDRAKLDLAAGGFDEPEHGKTTLMWRSQ
jgi:hypothetical protein